MAAERNEWVYDQLLGFLGGPLFQLPVITYMENRCIIFEPGTEDSQEYRQVHKEYKRLLEALLEGFMKDTNLTHDLLLKALGDLNTVEDLRDIFQSIFEQILAMDDFKIFVHLMSQKNIELQQQALMLIAQRVGAIPVIFQVAGDPSAHQAQPGNPASEEEAVLKAVLEQSKREYEEMKRSDDAEREQLERILATSRSEVTKLEQERVQEQEKINQAIGKLSLEPNTGSTTKSSPNHKTPPSFAKPPFAAMPVPSGRKISLEQPANTRTSLQTNSAASSAKSPSVPSGKASSRLSGSEAAANWLQSAMSDTETSSGAVSKAANAMGNLTPQQIKERQDYLRQQRDKLLEMKKRERAKQLQNAEMDVRERPTSARVAHKAMAGQSVDGPKSNVEDERKLAMRKAIADRLKAEVIGNK